MTKFMVKSLFHVHSFLVEQISCFIAKYCFKAFIDNITLKLDFLKVYYFYTHTNSLLSYFLPSLETFYEHKLMCYKYTLN